MLPAPVARPALALAAVLECPEAPLAGTEEQLLEQPLPAQPGRSNGSDDDGDDGCDEAGGCGNGAGCHCTC